MLVSKSTQSSTFVGEDGERLTLQIPLTADDNEIVALSLECDGHHFRTTLASSEVNHLREFLKFSYRDAELGSVAFSGQQGERLIFSHSNMGEPYREGVDIHVEGVKDFPDFLGPFIESSVARHVRDFITQ